ncbi:photosynthetic NDH subunit of lumenal location 4, chloroplastic-like [Aristolochia californica]|uniref:photosynthetic NDH subunit of lumenal location 4, chloroplastic-like n=1 Tax=Aristolochia californica TaxID=171875 RepID=UPI0035D5A886
MCTAANYVNRWWEGYKRIGSGNFLWWCGVSPMVVGGKRKLRIPPELAYGPEPAGCFQGDCNIPANATLLYDINFVGLYK